MGKEIYFEEGLAFIELTNETGLSLTLSTYGAGIYEVKLHGVRMNHTPKSKLDYANSLAYYGKTVGRMAGRIKNGVLHFNGVDYPLSKNEKGKQTLHGGETGYSFREWGHMEKEDKEAYYVCFYLLSPHLDNGFPHSVRPGVVYCLFKKKNEFQIQLFCESEETTPVNLTNHTYWNLGEKDVLNSKLTIRSRKVAYYDEDLVAQGYEKPIESLDLYDGKIIGECVSDPRLKDTPAAGIDHNFLFDGVKENVPSIILDSGKIKLEVRTSLPSAQVYTANYPSDLIMDEGSEDIKQSSVAIEPQLKIGIENQLVSKKEPYAYYIDYIFSEEKS